MWDAGKGLFSTFLGEMILIGKGVEPTMRRNGFLKFRTSMV